MPRQVISIRIADIAPWRCLSLELAQRYAAMLRAGQQFPPILVVRQSGRYGHHYRLFDGYHRTRAAKLAGRKVIDAVVIATSPLAR